MVMQWKYSLGLNLLFLENHYILYNTPQKIVANCRDGVFCWGIALMRG